MQDKETKLIEKLIDDKAFLTKFSENKSLEEQLKFLKENGFNFSEVEFKDFIKSLEEAYVSSENMSEEDLENVSGGKMEMRSKIAAAALVFSALGAGSMMGQVSAGWSDWLPHNLIISAYNWMFSSSDGDGQGNAAASSAQGETSQQSESKPASMLGSSTERSELTPSSTSGNSSQRSKSAQPQSQKELVKDNFVITEKNVEAAKNWILKEIVKLKTEYEKANEEYSAFIQQDTTGEKKKAQELSQKAEKCNKKLEIAKKLNDDFDKAIENQSVNEFYQNLLKRKDELLQQLLKENQTIIDEQVEVVRFIESFGVQKSIPSAQPISPYGNAQRQTGASSPVFQAPVVAEPSLTFSSQQAAQSQNDYVAKFKEAKANGTLIKFVQEIEEEYNSLTAIRGTEISPGEKKGLEERLESIRKVRMFSDYKTAKRNLERNKQSAASSSAPGVTRADAKTPDSKTFTQAGQVSSQPYSPYGNAQLVTWASSPVFQAPAVPDRIVAPSVSTKDADETLRGLKEKLERLDKEIKSIRSGSPDLEKDEELLDEQKGAIQAEYMDRLERLEKEHKETKERIEKMEKEREKQSKQESKRQTEEGQRSVSTTSAAAEAAPTAVTTDQSELRAAEIAVAQLIDLKGQKAKLEQERITTLFNYLGPKEKGETDAVYEKRGCDTLGMEFVNFIERNKKQLEAVDSQIKTIEENLRAAGRLALVKSMEEKHSGIKNLGGTCYLNTALQVLTQESAKDTVTGKSFKEEILELTQEQKAGCPVLCALSDFFTAYDKERVDGANLVSRITMQKIFNVLKNIKASDGKNKEIVGRDEYDQSDTTEALGKIINECIRECQGKPELAALKGTIERLFNVVSNQDYVNGKCERKLIAGTAKINFDEFFHDRMVNEVTSKNIVIPFSRSSDGEARRGQFNYIEQVSVTTQGFQQALRELGEQERGEFLEKHKGATVFPAEVSTNWEKLEYLYNNSKSQKDKNEMFKAIILSLLRGKEQVVIDGATYVTHDGKVCRRVPKYTGNIKVKNPIEIKESITVKSKTYRLKAISIHSGAAGDSGHYYAYVRSSINPDVWLCYNDTSVSPRFGPISEDPKVKCHRAGEKITNTRSLIEDPYVQQNATNLVYELVE